ncbi:MAG: hypothetical protein U0872_00800 [Planctomycetaceae bacterium]
MQRKIAPLPLMLGVVMCFGTLPAQCEDEADDALLVSDQDWRLMEETVDQGLAWLARQQLNDGSFCTNTRDEPGITGLCVMAFLSRGHLPGQGRYGTQLERARDYLLTCQQPDGLVARQRHPYHGAYSHGIGSLVIAEMYGMSKTSQEPRHRQTIERAIQFSGHRYSQPKANPEDEGGWRYLRRHAQSDSDLSVTSWNVMFLRSAKNSGFDVNGAWIEEALAYMKRLYDPSRKTFRYEFKTDSPEYNHTRGMAGAGVLSFALAGQHQSDMAKQAAQAILNQPFDQYVRPARGEEYPCYAAFYCSQGMFQMGGKYWREFYPQTLHTLAKAQRGDGSWIVPQGGDSQYGAPYMTALSILALTPPYQMLPIFQR